MTINVEKIGPYLRKLTNARVASPEQELKEFKELEEAIKMGTASSDINVIKYLQYKKKYGVA